MDVDQLPLPEPPVAQAKVERRPHDADDVRLFQGGATGVLEEELVVGGQRAAPRPVEEDGQPAVLGESGELGGRAVPPDAVACDDRGPLRGAQQVCRRHQLVRVGERARRGGGGDDLRVAVREQDVGR